MATYNHLKVQKEIFALNMVIDPTKCKNFFWKPQIAHIPKRIHKKNDKFDPVVAPLLGLQQPFEFIVYSGFKKTG